MVYEFGHLSLGFPFFLDLHRSIGLDVFFSGHPHFEETSLLFVVCCLMLVACCLLFVFVVVDVDVDVDYDDSVLNVLTVVVC